MAPRQSISEKTQAYLINTRNVANNVNKLTINGQRIVDNINRNILGNTDDE